MSGLTVHFAHKDLQVDEEEVHGLVQRAIEGEGYEIEDLSIVLADHTTVHTLNRDWLGHDYETDVVSFVLDEEAQVTNKLDGEIYVDLDTAFERAQEFGATFEQEAMRYIVHGLLHLMGYNDATEYERRQMRTLEDRYLFR